jgi:hypothetical protein
MRTTEATRTKFACSGAAQNWYAVRQGENKTTFSNENQKNLLAYISGPLRPKVIPDLIY